MADTPNFAKSPRTKSAVTTLASANVNTDTPTNAVLLCAAPADRATNITRITVQPRATTTGPAAGYLFSSEDTAGTVKRLKDSVTIPTQTINTAGGIIKTPFVDYSEQTPLRLGPGESLWAGASLAGNYVFNVEMADF